MNPKYIVIHSTDVSWKKNRDQLLAVNQYHKSEGFPRSTTGYYVGYHAMVTGGKLYKTREEDEIGAHTNQVVDGLSMNLQSLGICFGGDGDVEYPHPDDYALLLKQVRAWQDKYGIPNERVRFHRHYHTGKTCPGSLLGEEWLRNLLNRTPASEIKPDEQEEKQRAILMQQITWLQQLIALYTQLRNLTKF